MYHVFWLDLEKHDLEFYIHMFYCSFLLLDENLRQPHRNFALQYPLVSEYLMQSSCEVPLDFHPRAGKSSKTYEYRILNREFRDPTRRLDTYFYHYDLDVDAMQKAADFLVGEHDFKSFCSVHAQVESTVRTIYACNVSKQDDEIRIRVTGNGFLYNMVRIIAGTLMEVGKGRFTPEQVKEIIEAKDRTKAGPTAAAKGLLLYEYSFEKM